MATRHIVSALLSSAVIMVPAQRAMADGGDVVGGIIGGVIGGVIVNEATKRRQQQRTVVVRQSSSAWSAQREENRQVQTALNYFGFPAGSPDGVLGRNSRAAISGYQAHMGYPATGQLTLIERDYLLQSYSRAIAGGAYTSQQIAQYGMGPRGLLIAYRDEANGVAPRGQTVVAQPSQTVVVAAPEPEVAPEPVETVTASTAPLTALPNFASTPNTASMASDCNEVSLITSSNGGFTTVANVTDPNFTLSEQFCLARTYAIAEGESLAKSISGMTMAEMQKQCEGFTPAMQALNAAVSLKQPADVIAAATDFALSSGIPPAQLATTAKICLSVGYRTDNPDVAVSSNLLLIGLGQQAYGEMLGHHLRAGYGTAERSDLSRNWYQSAISALEAGATAVFAPGQSDRVQLLKVAALGETGALAQPVPASAGEGAGFKLPTFKSNQP